MVRHPGALRRSSQRKIVDDFLPLLLVYNDGTVHRFINPPHVPPSLSSTPSSKDITLSPPSSSSSSSNPLSARLYLPSSSPAKLPILLCFHGGFFCVGSAFSAAHHRFASSLSSLSPSLLLSVDYRLAPEHPLPAAYHDAWTALQWLASHSTGLGDEHWLTLHADFNKIFIIGDSSGGNIAHYLAMKAGREGLPNGVTISGVIVIHPFFWGSDPMADNLVWSHEDRIGSRLWKFVYPDSPGGLDDPLLNPCAPGAPDLAGLGCSRLLVCVAEKDPLRERNLKYYEAVRDSDWVGEVELYEVAGEDHVFHVLKPEAETSKMMMKRLVSFINKSIDTTKQSHETDIESITNQSHIDTESATKQSHESDIESIANQSHIDTESTTKQSHEADIESITNQSHKAEEE
ncbi:hypothetical protein HYC85_012994 [Camellia sinensis]|uniref:Alpha/beta hydrolase fold-3 domain-containing protein n=1 Tax=Camellia sinensis TaxID=4442 RepID=A0A7J7HFK7_CAMSI|nr:hypothetical protein HYC85_012994 [Camellia sinensis]